MNLLKQIKGQVRAALITAPTVEEIHNEIYSIQDILFKESENVAKKITGSEESISMAKQLYQMGFHFAENIGEPVRALEALETIKEYQQDYPNYKFIDEDSVLKICKKYALYLCNIHDFISFIPLKNQREILAFRVREKHLYNNSRYRNPYHYCSPSSRTEEQKKALSKKYEIYRKEVEAADKNEALFPCYDLRIIAPESQINMTHKEKRGHQIVQKDPIILQPVKKGYLIVTAWGDEASDPIVVNEKMN